MIEARCSQCDNQHSLIDRPLPEDSLTTQCPVCQSTQYDTVLIEGVVSKSEAERIEDYLSGIKGVGENTISEIQNSFTSLYELKEASIEELIEVKGVGEKVAERISDNE